MTDRPWATTLGQLGARGFTGQLTLEAEGKHYCIVFDHGAVVGATSPLASDSATRVALIHHMIAPAQVGDLTRRIAAAPDREEIEVLADAARLSLDQTVKLRHKVIEQRAARTFSVDEGAYVLHAKIDIPIVTGFAIDVRSVIYLGARMNLSEQRLGDELRGLGQRFVLPPAAVRDLPHFGFTEAERPILDALMAGTTLAELEAQHRALDPRTARAVIYSLVTCGVCTGSASPARPGDAGPAPAAADFAVHVRAQSPTPSDVYLRTRSTRDVFVSRAAPGGAAAPGEAAPRTVPPLPRSPSRAPAAGPDETGVPRANGLPRTSTSPSVARPPTPQSAERPTQRGMPVASRTPTPNLPRTQSPNGLVSPAVPATGSGATDAPSTSGTGPRRRISTQIPIASAPDGTDPAAPAADPVALAREAFKRGQSRLRVENLEDAIADLSRAVELAPGEVDYAATLAWAKFCHASNKQGLGQATREALSRAIRKSPTPELARFYLGRVERMLGRDKEALRHFHEVLDAQPRHADAAAEVRAIEARMAQAAAKESGVFGRKR